MPNSITFALDNKLTIIGADNLAASAITEKLTILNPQWIKNERLRRYNGKTEKYLQYFLKKTNGEIVVPRGFMRQAYQMCGGKSRVVINDKRLLLPEIPLFDFTGELRPYQEDVVEDVKGKDFAIVIVPTAGGKTIIASYMIYERLQPTLVIIPNMRLLKQWLDESAKFLSISKDSIGVFGDGKQKVGSSGLTIGIINTIYKHPELANLFGHIIVDECHRAASQMYRDALSMFSAKYMLGLTATLKRSDELEDVVNFYLGETVSAVESADLKEQGFILNATPVYRRTEFDFGDDAAHKKWKKEKPSEDILLSDPKAYKKSLQKWKKEEPITAGNHYTQMLGVMIRNLARNEQIVNDVLSEISKQSGIVNVILLLSDRKEHCEILSGLLKQKGVDAAYLHGGMKTKEQDEVVSRMKSGNIQAVAATGQMVGEGFDCKALTALFLATPVKFEGRLLQYLGRIMRPMEGKGMPKVYDYIDDKVGVLENQTRHRKAVYKG